MAVMTSAAARLPPAHAGFMQIILVAPLVSVIDDEQKQIGGAQVLVADLARGLAGRGHDVTLIAANGSRLRGVRVAPIDIDSAQLVPAALGVTAAKRPDTANQAAAFAKVRAWLDEEGWPCDVIHAHAYDAPAFTALGGAPRPVFHTLHLPPQDADVVHAARLARDAVMVTVSEANARGWRAAGVPIQHVVHNGIALDDIQVGADRGPHLLCAGRISPEKGVDIAISLAHRIARPLLIVGGIYDRAYFERSVAPEVESRPEWRVGDEVRGAIWIGARRRDEVLALMRRAAVTVMPVRWDEPFGLVAVEALATGTPVAGFRRGGLAEIVDESCGALAEPDDEDDLDRAVRHALTCSPEACRSRAEHFSLGAMLTGYERIFEDALRPSNISRGS